MNYYTKNVEQSYLQAHNLLCTRQAQEAALTLADLTKIATSLQELLSILEDAADALRWLTNEAVQKLARDDQPEVAQAAKRLFDILEPMSTQEDCDLASINVEHNLLHAARLYIGEDTK